MNDLTDPIYLDYNATTPLLPEVLDAMLPYLREHFGNPSSSHVFGRRARNAIERAREQVAALLACDCNEIVFASGGTEASNLAIRGAAAAREGRRRRIATSTIEHPATANPCAWLERSGWSVSRVPVDTDGRVQVEELTRQISPDTALVTIMHSNNESGVLQPIAEIVRTARQVDALVHTDAAQSIGKVIVNVRDLDVDLLSIAGHKLYAPKGIGALFVRRGLKIPPFMLGAGHERGLRPGTENVASIVALGKACEIAQRDLEAHSMHLAALRDHMWSLLRQHISGIRLNGHSTQRLPNTLNVSFPSVSGSALLNAAPEIAASTGSACHEGHESPSAVLLAMGLRSHEALGAVRLTLGRFTTPAHVQRASDALVRAWRTVLE